MFVILTYDVQVKRTAKVMKTVKKYLFPVQRSVFEGHLTDGKLKRLKKELQNIIEPEKDSIIIYKFLSYTQPTKEMIGKNIASGYTFL